MSNWEEFEVDAGTGERRDLAQHQVSSHTFRYSFAMYAYALKTRHPNVLQALRGHEKCESTEVYTKVFSLDAAAASQYAGVLAGNAVGRPRNSTSRQVAQIF